MSQSPTYGPTFQIGPKPLYGLILRPNYLVQSKHFGISNGPISHTHKGPVMAQFSKLGANPLYGSYPKAHPIILVHMIVLEWSIIGPISKAQ